MNVLTNRVTPPHGQMNTLKLKVFMISQQTTGVCRIFATTHE